MSIKIKSYGTNENDGRREYVRDQKPEFTHTTLKRKCTLYLESDPETQREEWVELAVGEDRVVVGLPERGILTIGHISQNPEEENHIRLPNLDDVLNICVRIKQEELDKILDKLHKKLDGVCPGCNTEMDDIHPHYENCTEKEGDDV